MTLIEIFKAGKRPDANGLVVDITPADLEQAVKNYDPAFHEAPAVIGHPKHNHPAYAWVKGLQLDGDVLKAELDQIDPEFAEMVEKGRFKKISASFYLANSPANPKKGSLYLRHVGFLGAMPPAVKGLRNPEFNEHEEGVVEFNDYGQANLFARLREWLISKFGIEEANQALPPYEADWLKEDAMREQLRHAVQAETTTPSFTEASTQPEGEPEMSAVENAELARLKAENEALKAAQARAEAEKAQAELNQTKVANADFAENLVKEGKLAPVAKAAAVAMLDRLAMQVAGEALDFDEGENLLTTAKAFLAAQPQVLAFGELATKDNASPAADDSVQYAEGTSAEAIETDQAVRAYMKQHNVGYIAAFNAIHA